MKEDECAHQKKANMSLKTEVRWEVNEEGDCKGKGKGKRKARAMGDDIGEEDLKKICNFVPRLAVARQVTPALQRCGYRFGLHNEPVSDYLQRGHYDQLFSDHRGLYDEPFLDYPYRGRSRSRTPAGSRSSTPHRDRRKSWSRSRTRSCRRSRRRRSPSCSGRRSRSLGSKSDGGKKGRPSLPSQDAAWAAAAPGIAAEVGDPGPCASPSRKRSRSRSSSTSSSPKGKGQAKGKSEGAMVDLQEFKQARYKELLGDGPIRFRVTEVSLCECRGRGQPFEEVASLLLAPSAPPRQTLLSRSCPCRSRQ